MLVYAVFAALAVFAIVVAAPLLRRNHRLDEVDRFHVARSLTTAWSSEPIREFHMSDEGEEPDAGVRPPRRHGRRS